MTDLALIVEPALMWLWNAPPSEDGIRRQLDAFLNRGVRAVYIHPMPSDFRPHDFHGGMEIEYLSDEFFHWIAFAAAEIHEREMLLWLYDEGGWPSGVAGGRVVAEDPDFGAWVLRRPAPGERPTPMHAGGTCPDLMNPEAAACFIRHTHRKYREAVGHLFGTTIRGLFTDEARLFGRVGSDTIPWSPRLAEAFEQEHGLPLEQILDPLFETGPTHVVAQRKYLRTVSRLIAEAYYAPLRQWCNRHGLLFEGHHTGEDDFARHGVYFGDYLQQARHYDIPGVDAIWQQIFPGESKGNYAALASSSAWAHHRQVALTESFAVYGAGLSLEQMHWTAAFQLVRGVNKFAIMAALYSVTGPRRICTCHDIGPHDPRWRDFDLFVEFVRRTAVFTLSGQPRPTVGVYYRMELVEPSRADAFTREHEVLCNCILDHLNAVMFVGLDDLVACGLPAVAVHVDAPLTEAEEFAFKAAGVERVTPGNERTTARFSLLAPIASPGGIRVLPLETRTGLNLLFFNEADKEADVVFHARDEYGERVLDDELAPHIHPIVQEGNRVHLHLAPWQMRALVAGGRPSTPWTALDTHPLQDRWVVREIERYVIADTIWCNPVTQSTHPVQLGDYAAAEPEFSGSLEYQCSFQWQARSKERVVLDLGKVRDSAELTLNGVKVGRRAWRPFWFDVTEAVQSGTNILQVRVTNTLANQWLRPALEESDAARWPNPYRKRVRPFLEEGREVGLFGPVVARRFRVS